MVPAITAGGRSFRGAALYYLHDRRQEGEAERFTSGRVAWVETVNLPTGDPERAWRIMAHTALAQAKLKAAAGASIAAQGLEEHQAIILAHTDEPQGHVHIIVNRVHPVTGKAATLSNSKLKLSQWAEAYERKRGKVYCPQRVENNARRRQGEFVRHPRTPLPLCEFNRATGNDHLGAVFA